LEPTAEPTPAAALPATAEQITHVAPGQGEIALLFNADSFPGHITTILETLRARDTHLTFFLTGSYLERYPEEVRAIDAAGHEIASHGYDHVDFRDLPDAQIVSQIDQWRAKLAELTGKVGPQYWQPPYGYSNARVQQAAAAHGYTTIYWTRDVLDAVGQPKSKHFVLDRVLQSSIELDGAIILMHVDKDGTIEALPELLDALAQRGLRAVTVSELLRK
jgi:peptidoglycan-N-acetylglucosamine deacetylase